MIQSDSANHSFVGLHAARGNKLAKRLARPLSSFMTMFPLATAVRYIEAYVAFLQGKGSGAGWDLREEIDAATANIFRADPVVFDVGANVGLWSQALVERLPGARMFLFEPSSCCRRAIAERCLPNSEVIPAAVGRASGEAMLYSSSPTDGTASLHVRRDSFFSEREYHEYKVEVTTIDTFVASQKLDFVDYIKMDIEGHELDALLGAEYALKQGTIGALSFEFGSGNINSRTFFHDFWDLLGRNSYLLYRITPAGRLLPIQRYYEDLEYFRGVSNYVARLARHPLMSA
jgi:FkbM family methyltransferase